LFEGQSLKKEKKNWKLEELEPNTLYDNDEANTDNDKKQELTQNNS
jgi:hypothetical protein